MRNLISRFGIFSFMAVLFAGCGDGCPIDTGRFLPGACVTEPGTTFSQGTGIPWTFNVTNQSDSAITIKVTPMRNDYLGDPQGLNRYPPSILDGPIVEKQVAQGVSESLVVRTGESFGGGLVDPRVFRSFTFEIKGLNTGAIVSFGWPVSGAHDTTLQYYGLGYMYNAGSPGSVSPDQLLSSLAPGHYLSSDPIYNVIVENPNSIKWSLDEKVRLDEVPPPPPS